jgi:hypothetical protein
VSHSRFTLADPKKTSPDDWTLSTRIFGSQITVTQEDLSLRVGDGDADTTGRIVWECGNVMLRWLERGGDAAFFSLAGRRPATRGELSCVDVSAGAGFCALALAAAGLRHVGATETGAQLAHLRRNLAGSRVRAAELRWGGDAAAALRALLPPPPPDGGGAFDFCVISDVLYIALRDGLGDALRDCVARVARALARGGGVFFGFEERLIDAEAAWLRALPGAGVSVEELPRDCARIERAEALEGAGGPRAPDALADVFWQPPDVRLFVLRASGEAA